MRQLAKILPYFYYCKSIMEYATHITGEYIIANQETKLFKSEEKLQLLIVKKIIQTF